METKDIKTRKYHHIFTICYGGFLSLLGIHP